MILNGQVLVRVHEIDYLGNAIRSDLTEVSDVKAKVEDLSSRVNTIKYSLSGANRLVKAKMFNVKCAHAYGSETWQFSDKCTMSYWTAYGQGARRLLGLPPSCPSLSVQTYLGSNNVKNMVMKKFINLVKCMQLSSNSRLKFIHDVAMADARSFIRKNISYVVAEWGNMVPPVFVPDVGETTVRIRELIDFRDGVISTDLSPDDIDERMLLLCAR